MSPHAEAEPGPGVGAAANAAVSGVGGGVPTATVQPQVVAQFSPEESR